MEDTFSVAIINCVAYLGAGWIFFICLSAIILFSIFEFILALLRRGSVKVYASHFILLFSVCVVDISLSSFVFNDQLIFLYPFILLGLGLLFFIPTFIVKDKKLKVEKSHKKFIEFLDEKIKAESLDEKSEEQKVEILPKEVEKKSNATIILEKIKPQEEKKTENTISFSHVKNVLEKVRCYNLSTADLKQVNDLKANVYMAENGGIDNNLKEKINDGLGALLKIMAKYGV